MAQHEHNAHFEQAFYRSLGRQGRCNKTQEKGKRVSDQGFLQFRGLWGDLEVEV